MTLLTLTQMAGVLQPHPEVDQAREVGVGLQVALCTPGRLSCDVCPHHVPPAAGGAQQAVNEVCAAADIQAPHPACRSLDICHPQVQTKSC